MKIIYLHQYFNTPSMAGGTRSYEFAKRMVEAGHEVHMISTWRGEEEATGWWHEHVDGINVHWLPVRYDNSMSFGKRVSAFMDFALRAGPKAASIGGDLVFATSTPLTIAIPAIFASRRLGCPMVFEVRDLWPELPIAIGALKHPLLKTSARLLEKVAYNASAHVVALSPGMAEGVRKTGFPAERIHVIPNSCDNKMFAPSHEGARRFHQLHPELGDGPLVLYAGTFGQINGVGFLPDLASRLTDAIPQARFVAIGNGAEAETVLEHARELGVLNKNYFQYPAMPKHELVDAFQAADISMSLFIDLPEMWHNSANKFFDTLASGTPIAINYFGWQAKLIEQHEVGLVVGPDLDVAAAKLHDLLDNPAMRKRMGENARSLALTAFDRDKLAQELLSVLGSVVTSEIEK